MQRESERGVILIFVAIIMVVMMGLGAFVVDYGVFWLARAQAQNAADGGALAGGVARAFDEPLPGPAGPITTGSATTVVNSNPILGVVGVSIVDTSDAACPAFSPATLGPCVQVDVYRDGSNGSARFASYFANVFGVTDQGIRATATAQVKVANTSNCLKPWLIPDRFTDANGNFLFDAGDTYVPPTEDNTTGYTPANSLGTTIVLKSGTQGSITPGNYFEVGDATTYEESIPGCRLTRSIGDTISVLPGNRQGPTKRGTNDLIAQDPNAVIDGNGDISGSCAPSTCGAESPRLVSIAVYDPREYRDLGFPNGGNYNLTIVNILTMFIVDVDNQGTVTGVFLKKAGNLTVGGGTGTVPNGAAFMNVVQLIQ